MEPRERVVLKSIELFSRYGIRQVTMDQIASELGMSKRTIYELFKDKDTLLWECLETMHRQHNAEINHILNGSSNVIEALYLLGQHGEKKKSTINIMFFEDIRKGYPHFWETMNKRNKPGSGSFSYAILKKGVEEGIFRDDIRMEVVDAFIHVIMDSYHSREAYPAGISRKDILKNTIIPYYMGIATEKGKHLIEAYIKLL
jgi:AcrR family transcriptional regulator